MKWLKFRSLVAVAAALVLAAGTLWAATIEVSQPTYLTSNSQYDRNPSIIHDGSNYWLFWTKADNATVRGTGTHPDGDTYVVYYKTAATIAGLAGAAETQLTLSSTNRPASFTQRVVSATYFNGKVYAFVSSGQDGTDRGLYYYVYSGGTWSGPTTLIADATASGGHVNVTSDANRVYIVWEQEGGTSVCYTWNGTTLNGPINISTDNMPRITLMGTTLYVVSIEDGTGDIEVYSAAAGASPSFSSHSTAIPGAGLYDPCIFNDGTNLYVVTAPYDGGNDQQWLIQAKYSGGSWAAAKRVSYGGYSDTYWWDYWPMGYYDGADLYVFFTTETSSPTYSDAEIAYFKMDWDLSHDHYFYIQNAVDQASSGDVINVAAGTYTEAGTYSDHTGLIFDSTRDGITLRGANAGIPGTGTRGPESIIEGPNVEHGNAIYICDGADGVIIDGFTLRAGDDIVENRADNVVIENNIITPISGNPFDTQAPGIFACECTNLTVSHNWILDIGMRDSTTGGCAIYLGLWGGGYPVTNSLIEHNLIDNSNGTGILALDTQGGGITIRYNTIRDVGTQGVYHDDGIRAGALGSGLTIEHNDIYNCTNNGVQIKHDAASHSIHYNSIYNNSQYGVKNTDTATLDATKNWWGDTDPTDDVNGNVDYSPWLGASPITGTAPNITDVAHPWTWYTDDSVQDAIDAATAGDIIKVVDGNYDGFTANKEGITVQASSAPVVSGTGISADGHTVGILVSAHNVTIDGFKVDGNYSTGIYVYDATTPPHSATIKNCIVDLTGYDATQYGSWDAAAIMAKPGGSPPTTIEGNTLMFGDASYATNPPKASNGIKAFCGQGPDYIIKDNTIIITKYGKYATGINFGSGDDGSDEASASVLIEGNEVYAPGCDGTSWDKVFGIWLYGGAGAYVNDADVHDNNVHNTNYALWVSGPNCADINVTGNDFTDSGFGFVIEDGVPDSELHINFNNIHGNSSKGGYSDGNQTVDAEKNWWGHYSGPSTSKGSGDAVSGDVDYDPWLHGWTSNGLGLKYITEPQGQTYCVPPVLDLTFYDDVDLSAAYYQYDSYSGGWTAFSPAPSGTEYTYASWTLPGFNSLGGGSHTIYFKASDGTNEEGESGEWSWQFNVETAPPTIPVLISPANGAILTDHTPTFIWHTSTDACPGVDKYELMYADNPTFSGPSKVVKYLTDTTYTPSSDLTADLYYWAVKAIDGLGNSSFWSDKWSFTYDNVPPAAPTLVSPIGGVWLDDTLVAFNWTSVTHKGTKGPGTPVHYIFQLDDNNSFSSPLTDTTDATSYNLTLAEGFYYWRVRAYDDAGNQGSFSGTESFGVDITRPGSPTLVSPPDSALQNTPTIVFIWNSATDNLSGVDHYVLEYTAFGAPTSVNVADTVYVTDTLADDTYRWRVRAVDGAGNEGPWSTRWYVTIDTQAPGVPVLISPSDSSYINTITPTFVWGAATSTYCLQVGLDISFSTLVIDTCGLTDTFYAVTDSALFDTLTYYWRVEVIDDAGNHSGYQVHPYMFTIDTIPPPTPPTLLLPPDSSYTNDNTPTFVWTAVLDSPITYCLQVATDTLFDSITIVIDTCALTDTIYTVSDTLPLADSIYHWRVEAVDRAGNTSGYQAPFMFTIDTQTPIFTLTTVWDDTSFAGPYPVSSVITDALSGVDSAFLYYSFDAGTTWTSVVMQLTPPDTYEADIPQVPDSSNTNVQYYLMANDLAGNIGYDPVGAPDSSYSFIGGATTDEKLGTEEQVMIPTEFALQQNLPNPFSSVTSIQYSVVRSTHIVLNIYDIAGNLVKILVNEEKDPGYYNVNWDGKDDTGKSVTNGIYFYRIQASNYTSVRKMILMH